MNNWFEVDCIEDIETKEKYISFEIKETIINHCYSNPIEIAIQKMRDNITKGEIQDWDNEILIFNYISDYLRLRFPDIFINKTEKEKLDIMYEAIKYFLEWRDRKSQIPRVLAILKNNNKIDNIKNNKLNDTKNIVLKKIFAVFM